MAIRNRYAYGEWTSLADPEAEQEYSVECLEHGCGAEFKIKDGPAEADGWKYQHTIHTGHRRFWETHGRAMLVGPPPGAIVAGEIVGREQAANSPERGRPRSNPCAAPQDWERREGQGAR
ncbi:hypothetical protein [Streptomyces sp. NPDC008001]|uniref:DUF7848 domain-containing protein n=1 Tax=Streptomyces sp. NPDC008001 TaxID=3364804 RepID=UPI0036EAB189